ncbi:hypothetical protein MTP99_002924 [Tenebrio molitor]|nr:hypothetical protein MTP99_002924 [Tenebrio molitor]
MYKKGRRYLVAAEPFGDGVRDLEECSGRGSEESAARTYCYSGRTWTLLALLSFRSDLDAAGSSCSGRRERRVKGTGMAVVPSQWEGTGQENGESGKAGVPSQWEGTGQENGESGKAGVPSQWEGTGQERGESGKAGVPSQREGTGQESGESGKAGVPSQWEGTGQESGEGGLSARSEAESESVLELGYELEEDRDRNELCRLGAVLLLPRWDCARPATRGWGGGGARLSVESGCCRPEETRVPERIRSTRFVQLVPR